MDLGLASRSCIVTGASKGIGRRTAEMLRSEGAEVLMVARKEGPLRAAAEQCGAAWLVCDITDADAGARMVDAALKSFGSLDVLVNNAGAAQWRDLEEVPDEDWQAALDLNVIAPMRAMRAALPAMRERGWGRIVNVSSTAGKRPSKNMPEYSVAKAAELSLSKLFADRYADDGILINAVCPGPTKSEMWMDEGGLGDQAAQKGGHSDADEARQKTGAGRPIGRLAEVDEIASVIVFLCSEHASYVSGAAWSVDGGTIPIIL